MLSALQTAVSRSVSPLVPVVLSFGQIEGGTAKNIICDEVHIGGTLRTTDETLREKMRGRVRDICQGVAAAFGATVEVNIIPSYRTLVNDPDEVERVLRLGRELRGAKNALLKSAPSMGGEDFAYFCAEAPGAFYDLGCSAQQPVQSLHKHDFVLDERCLPLGVALQCALVWDRLFQ
jgi:amidohydrolase